MGPDGALPSELHPDWSHGPDSNRQPELYESPALPLSHRGTPHASYGTRHTAEPANTQAFACQNVTAKRYSPQRYKTSQAGSLLEPLQSRDGTPTPERARPLSSTGGRGLLLACRQLRPVYR